MDSLFNIKKSKERKKFNKYFILAGWKASYKFTKENYVLFSLRFSQSLVVMFL